MDFSQYMKANSAPRVMPALNSDFFADPETMKHPFRVVAGPGAEGQIDAWEVADGNHKTVCYAPTHQLAAAIAESFRRTTKVQDLLTKNALRRDCR
jgi:hypothetical protein